MKDNENNDQERNAGLIMGRHAIGGEMLNKLWAQEDVISTVNLFSVFFHDEVSLSGVRAAKPTAGNMLV